MTVSRADMLTLWPSGELVAHAAEQLRALGVRESVVRVLAHVGLPRVAEPFIFADDTVTEITGVDGALWRFASDGGVSIAVDAKTGCVLAGADADDLPTRFVNSCIEQFAASLCAVVVRYRQFPGLPDEEIDDLVATLEERVREIDPAALEEAEHWWVFLIEQMKDGLL